MALPIIHFPVVRKPPSGGFGFIKPIRIPGGNNIGLPDPFSIVDVGTLLAQQEQLNRTAVPTADKHLTVAAFDSTISVPYGHIKVPALLANAVVWNGYWFFWCLWGVGVIDAVESITINDGAVISTGFDNYTGTQTTVDPALSMAIGVVYRLLYNNPLLNFDQYCPGIAYSAVTAAVADITEPPTINAVLRGKKIYDPRISYHVLNDATTWSYSRNAALILGDFLRNRDYGAGLVVDDLALANAADACDAEGRTADILVDRKTKLSDWVATLQEAANCFIDTSGAAAELIPDVLGTSVATFSHLNGDIMGVSAEEGHAKTQLPTVMEIKYTDATLVTWKDASVQIERVGVDAGTVPWRKSSVSMPWITEFGDGLGVAYATRQAYLRMNKLWLRIPTMTAAVMDEGFSPRVGERIAVNYSDSGYRNIPLKIAAQKANADGWALGVFYDDPNAYVDDHIADPIPPTSEPDPFNVPAVRRLVGFEDPVDPKIIATWLPPQYITLSGIRLWPYVKDYPWRIDEVGASPSGADSGHASPSTLPSLRSIDLIPGNDYDVTVWVRSVFGQIGPPTTVRVHINAIVYVAFRYTFTTATLVNMVQLYNYGAGRYYWLTNMGDIWNPTFTNPLDTYTNPLATYHTPGTSTLTTETADATAVFDGDWAGTVATINVSGVSIQYIELGLTPSPLTRHAGALFTGPGRYVALSSEATGTGTQRVDDLGDIAITVTR